MRILKSAVMVSALTASVALFPTGSLSALPLSPAAGGTVLAVQLDQALPTIQVRGGGGVAAGVIGGMILGGIIASQAPRYYGYPPYGYPVYGYPAYRPYPAGDAAIAYCMRRFRSYDPYSMTYLGHDGFRHPCP
jgi:hypothetical protein